MLSPFLFKVVKGEPPRPAVSDIGVSADAQAPHADNLSGQVGGGCIPLGMATEGARQVEIVCTKVAENTSRCFFFFFFSLEFEVLFEVL